MSKYLNECLRFERLIFGRVKLSHIKGKKRYAERILYALFTYCILDTIHLQNACCFSNKKPYHFMAALPFSLVFKTEDRIGYRVRFTHLGIALTIRSDIRLIETVLELENKKLYTYQLCPSTGKKEWVVRRSSGPTSCFCATSYCTDCCYYSPLGSRDLC